MMVIEQVRSWVLVVQCYFFSLCRYVAFYVKRLGSVTFPEISDTTLRGGQNVRHNADERSSDSDKKQARRELAKLKPSSEIPGPVCYPVIGSLLEFNKFGSRRVHELAKDRHAKYGDIFREKILSQEMVFLANTELMKQWMAQEGKFPVSLKQEPSLLFAELYPQLKRGLFFRNGEEWYRLRKLGHAIILKGASDFESEGLFDGCQSFMEEYVQKLRNEVCKGGNEGVIEDLETMSYEIAVGATASVVYGRNEDVMRNYLGKDFEKLCQNAKELNVCHQNLLEGSARISKWLKTPDWVGFETKLKDNLETCMKYGQILKEEIKRNPEKCSMRTHGLLYKTMTLSALPDDVDDMLADFALDSKDPFASTVMLLTQVLGMHPEVQTKILQEVTQVCPDNQQITYDKLKHLEYTESFSKEVLRLYPVAAFTARVVTDNIVIGDYQITPGTMVMYSSCVAQRDSRYFSDPDKLIPERWLRNNRTTEAETPAGAPQSGRLRCDTKAFGVFGLNQRLCLGQHIATSIFVLYIANLVRDFEVTSESLPEMEMRTVLYPKHPGPVHLKTRDKINFS